MYFCFSLPQTNTPLGLALGIAEIWEWHETKQQQQSLTQVWTFLEDCLACRYAWTGVTEREWRHLIYSQALEPADQQQQGHYGQAPALHRGKKVQVCLEVKVERWRSVSQWECRRQRGKKDQGSMCGFKTGFN